MIVVKFSGGLGNQMYQYVIYKTLQKRYPNIPVKADISFYGLLTEHNGFEIDKVFEAGEGLSCAAKKEINSFCPKYIPGKFETHLPSAIKRKIAFGWQYKFTKLKSLLNKKQKDYIISGLEINAYNDLIFRLNADEHSFYLDGLWQNMQYFIYGRDFVLSLFHYKLQYTKYEKEISQRISDTNSVSIHLRRGDFVHSTLDICTKKYYDSAISMIKSRVNNPQFFIFSDDMEYARQLFGNLENALFVRGNKENAIYDMMLMSECKHNIISNSTFSFWASYLNINVNKIVLAPRYCVKNQLGSYLFSLPEEYITIEV